MLEAELKGYKGVVFLYHHIANHVIIQWVGEDIDRRMKAATEGSLKCFFEGLHLSLSL